MKATVKQSGIRLPHNRRRPGAVVMAMLCVFIPLCISLSDDLIDRPLGVGIELIDSQPQLRWSSAEGQRYEVEASDDLVEGNWSTIDTVEASETTTTWTDTTPRAQSRFYRLVYRVPGIVAPVTLTHTEDPNGLSEIATASFATISDQIKQAAEDGTVVLPFPMEEIDSFESLTLSDSAIYIDELRRAVVFSGSTTLRGQPVDLLMVRTWPDDSSSASGFSLSFKFPQFQLSDWVSGLVGTALADLTLDGAVLTIATASQNLNLTGFSDNVAGFYGVPELELQPGLNFLDTVDLAEAPGLEEPLRWLGFTEMEVLLEGFLGLDPNAIFQQSDPAPAPELRLQAHLPVSQPSVFPRWLRPKERILEFTVDPALRVRLLDILEATPDGQSTDFAASTEIDTTGGETAVTLAAGLAEPWEHPFGISWLTFNEAALTVDFSETGPGEIVLSGNFAAGNQTVTTTLTLTETGESNSASFVASVDQITLGDVLQLFSHLTGADPFGSNLPDDALVLSNAQFSFHSGDERSVTINATTTIRNTIQTDFLLSFVKPDADTTALVVGLRVHEFKLSALYAGINGTLAGDLEFPGVAFTVMQELPDPPSEPIEIPSGELDPAALDFYEPVLGTPPFVLELKAGVNFCGTFPQSKLPPLVLDTLGMDPAGKILLEGALGMRLGALSGGDLIALDSLNLKAILPPPARPRLGFPDWLADLQSGERTLAFTYVNPNIEVQITDTFQVELDGATRTFVTSTKLATDGEQAEITLAGDMVGGWAEPFDIDWLTLDTIGLVITGDGDTATAALHSSFQIGGKTFALELAISGGKTDPLVRFSGTVDSISLSDFIELARNQLGSDVDPFGDSDLDFTFTNVRLNIETGARSSFSLGADTTLKGKNTQVLFSAIPSPDGGLPQIITGFQMKDWSLADALDQVKGTFVEDFRLDTAALVFSKGEGTTKSEDMDPETRSFYGNIYGSSDFSVPFRNGLGLIGAVPMEGHPMKSGLDTLGMPADSLFLTGSVPGSIIGLGGGEGGLSGLSLLAALPPVSLPDGPDWFVSGQLGLEITAQPSVGFVGEFTVKIEGETLTFNVGATVQRAGANVEFALTGGLQSEEPWEQPFGIKWLIFNSATVKVAVNAAGGITLGFAGDMVVGEKDIDVAVAVTVTGGVPTNFVFEGESEEGVSMADLVMLQQQMAKVDDPAAPTIPLDALPDMAVRRVGLKFAPKSDTELGVEAGFAIKGELWIPSEIDGSADRNFAAIDLSVDLNGIVAQGHLGEFDLGPIHWSDAVCDIVLSLQDQHMFVRGAAEAGSFFEGDLDLGVTRTELSFLTILTIFDQFQAQLEAIGSFSLTDPQFTVRGLLQNDFGGTIIPSLNQKVRSRAEASASLGNELLRRGLPGWTTFRNDPHSLAFAERISNFASAAGWPSGDWSVYINAIQNAMEDIDSSLPGSEPPDDLLDLALGGMTIPGVPGVKTRVCIRRRLLPPFDCLEYQDRCNGVPYGGGACWTVPPKTIGGACHEPDLEPYDIPCSSTPFIEQNLISAFLGRIDTILDNVDRSPMIAIERAEFTATLNGLTANPVVTLASRVRFMQANTRLNLNTTWNFDNREASLNALRDALVNAL